MRNTGVGASNLAKIGWFRSPEEESSDDFYREDFSSLPPFRRVAAAQIRY
jgi:hypothetical protein